jgi:hypothetical protein
MDMLEQEGQVLTPEVGHFRGAVAQAVRGYELKSFSFKSSNSMMGHGDEEDSDDSERYEASPNTSTDDGDGEFILESVVRRHMLIIKQRDKVQVMPQTVSPCSGRTVTT